jgi:hypothetical protein
MLLMQIAALLKQYIAMLVIELRQIYYNNTRRFEMSTLVSNEVKVLGIDVDLNAMEDSILKRSITRFVVGTSNENFASDHRDRGHNDHSDSCDCICFIGGL